MGVSSGGDFVEVLRKTRARRCNHMLGVWMLLVSYGASAHFLFGTITLPAITLEEVGRGLVLVSVIALLGAVFAALVGRNAGGFWRLMWFGIGVVPLIITSVMVFHYWPS